MAEFSEGLSPKEQNKNAIKKAWVSLSKSIDRNRGEVLLDGQSNLMLRYASFKPLFGDIIRKVDTDIYEQISPNEGDDYARGTYEFKRVDDVIVAEYGADTDPHRQSLGYGSGLVSIVNEVITDAAVRFTDLQGKTIIGIMQDKAVGSDMGEGKGKVNRENWTSHQAQELGYIQDPETSVWFKLYQGKMDSVTISSILTSVKR